jgi:hypothetical protein
MALILPIDLASGRPQRLNKLNDTLPFVPDYKKQITFETHFLSSNPNVIVNAVTGAGSQSNVAYNTNINNSSTHLASTGTTATGTAQWNTPLANINLNGGFIEIVAIVQLPTLSTALQEYRYRFGLGVNVATVLNGVYFEYSRSVTGVNWQQKTTNTSVTTTQDTGIVVSTTFNILKIRIYSLPSLRVEYYINDVKTPTDITTNIPSTGTAMIIAGAIAKLVGTTASSVSTSYFKYLKELNTAR